MNKVAMMLSCVAVAGCSDIPVDDLVVEAKSPDGELIARMWCEDFCDTPGSRILTIEPIERAAPIEPGYSPQDDRRGDLSENDVAARLYGNGSAPDRLAWTAQRTLVFAVPCPTDGNYRAPGSGKVFRDVTIRYRDSSNGAACR